MCCLIFFRYFIYPLSKTIVDGLSHMFWGDQHSKHIGIEHTRASGDGSQLMHQGSRLPLGPGSSTSHYEEKMEIIDQEGLQLLRWNSLSSTEEHTIHRCTNCHLLIFPFAVLPFTSVHVCWYGVVFMFVIVLCCVWMYEVMSWYVWFDVVVRCCVSDVGACRCWTGQ